MVFFELRGGLRFGLFSRANLAHDAGLPVEAVAEAGFSLAHNVASPAEVDAVMQQAARAGATVIKPAQETVWGGYAGYFQDPDRHLWEVAWNPGLGGAGLSRIHRHR